MIDSAVEAQVWGPFELRFQAAHSNATDKVRSSIAGRRTSRQGPYRPGKSKDRVRARASEALLSAILGSVACFAGTTACSSSSGVGSNQDAVADGSTDHLGADGIGAPRLVAPISAATVTSQRPNLQWELAPGTDGVHVEICKDRECTSQVAAFDSTDSTGAPADNLAAGVLFWRAYGRSGNITGTASTPIWELVVGARSAPVDTAWGTMLDVNGDGFADAIVGGLGGDVVTGQVYVYMGNAGGLAGVASNVLSAPEHSDEFGWSVASAGDVNGDGYPDVIVGAPSSRRAYLYFGSSTGLATSPSITLSSPVNGSGTFGVAVAGAGDTNRDGYADVLVADGASGLVFVYLGSSQGLATSPSADFVAMSHSVATAGDINGDGYSDVIVGALESGSGGVAYVFYGGPSGISSSPSASLGPGSSGDDFGGSVQCAGDVNGDGYADVIVGADGAHEGDGAAYIYLGGPGGLSTTPFATMNGSSGAGAAFGISVAGAGDVDGDGYADVVVGAYDLNASDGGAYLYRGGTALSPTAAVTLLGPSATKASFGSAVAGIGDVNGSGYSSILVGAANYGSGDGAAYVFVGSASLVSTTASLVLSPTGSQELYGASVAIERAGSPARKAR